MDGERRRRAARRETAGEKWDPATAPSTGREARRSWAEEGKEIKREGGDVDTGTWVHVGPTLTQPPRRIKSGPKPPKNLL
jgi:hypothetical protein